MTTLFRRAGLVLAGTIALVPVLAAMPAAAHVTATPDEADSPFFRTTLRVGHGCEGSPTVSVRVQIPEGVENPRAEVVPGWSTEIVPAEESTDDGGGEDGDHDAGAAVAELAWVGGTLPDTHFQEFGLTFRITDDAPEVLWFPTVQECEEGEHRWIEIPASVDEWGDLDEPAPYVINNLAGGGSEDGDDGTAEAAADVEDDPQPSAATSSDDDTGALPVIALVAGLLGLAAGVAALLVAVRAGRGRPAATEPPASTET